MGRVFWRSDWGVDPVWIALVFIDNWECFGVSEIFDVKETVMAVRRLQMAYLKWDHEARSLRELEENIDSLKQSHAFISNLSGEATTLDYDELHSENRDRVMASAADIICRLERYELGGMFQQILNSLEDDFDPEEVFGGNHD
ncbi:hypothetical protein JI58_05285 [Marinosulfonomonas sp. PRT-SC04]|nr:hypothetical protein JI58_05285 [Marinosulfonomonas sp. PRT-SC04]